MATLAPSAARRFAIAAPMPREPPVTSATLLANLDTTCLFIALLLIEERFTERLSILHSTVECFLQDSAGFVGCCFALRRGRHRRHGHAQGREHVLGAREFLANLSMCRASGQLDPVESFPLGE